MDNGLIKTSPPLWENGDGKYNAHAFPVGRGAEKRPVGSTFICFLFLPDGMTDLGHLKHNQRVMLVFDIGMVFGKNSCRFAFLISKSYIRKEVCWCTEREHWGGGGKQIIYTTLPVETNHRGDSGINHSAAIWMIGRKACRIVGRRHDHMESPDCT